MLLFYWIQSLFIVITVVISFNVKTIFYYPIEMLVYSIRTVLIYGILQIYLFSRFAKIYFAKLYWDWWIAVDPPLSRKIEKKLFLFLKTLKYDMTTNYDFVFNHSYLPHQYRPLDSYWNWQFPREPYNLACISKTWKSILSQKIAMPISRKQFQSSTSTMFL